MPPPGLLLLILGASVALELEGEFTGTGYEGRITLASTSPSSFHVTADLTGSEVVARQQELGANPSNNSLALVLVGAPCGQAAAHLAPGGGEGRPLHLAPSTSLEGASLGDYATPSVLLVRCTDELCLRDTVILDCATMEVDKVFQLSLEIIIVLAVAAAIFVVIVICIPVCFCCIRRRRARETKLGSLDGLGESVEDPFLLESRHTKSQMSIPYMDASLPPTPKGGRSGFRLADFIGNNNSDSLGSLSEKPM